jgi:hypothetical protein
MNNSQQPIAAYILREINEKLNIAPHGHHWSAR